MVKVVWRKKRLVGLELLEAWNPHSRHGSGERPRHPPRHCCRVHWLRETGGEVGGGVGGEVKGWERRRVRRKHFSVGSTIRGREARPRLLVAPHGPAGRRPPHSGQWSVHAHAHAFRPCVRRSRLPRLRVRPAVHRRGRGVQHGVRAEEEW